jgi:hypothetical protein
MRDLAYPTGQVNSAAAFMLPEGREAASESRLFGDLVILLFLCAQVLDGVLTYVGLHAFGPSIEANPLLAWLIAAIGPAGALTSAKGAAIIAGSFLHLFAVHRLIAVLTGIYFLVAIVPWTHLLFFF